MRDFADYLTTALALVLIFEGLVYAFFPRGMQAMMSKMALMDSRLLRRAGIGSVVAGTALVWLLETVSR